jgi:glycosyltransferase involved in cell wall biosynthesis
MRTSPDHPVVAVVLPPREGFSPGAVGAVGLLVHRLARAASGPFRPVVIGLPPAAGTPFQDVAFLPAEPAWVLAPGNLRYAAGVARRIRALQPALIEVHNRPEVALAMARRFPAIPVSLFLHNDPQGMRNARTASERQALLRALARVVTVSSFLADRLRDGLSAPLRGPAVLPNCLDLSDLPPLASAGEREKVILFAGRIVADKGADAFVSGCTGALPRLPGWRAEMIGADRFRAGSPETPFIRRLRPQAEAAGIRLSGYRPHADVLAAMARAAIVAAPSRWPEPFGLTALEALACGAALLCSPRGGLREVAGDAAVFVDPDTPAGFADALVALAADPARRAALSEAGRARAALFDVHPAAQALDALREEILSS